MKSPMFIGSNYAILENGKEKLFQSYDSVIAFLDKDGKLYIDDDTTGTKLKQGTLFTRTTCKQLRIFIEDYTDNTFKDKETMTAWIKRMEKEKKIVRVNLNA